jgi:hypothetical protein
MMWAGHVKCMDKNKHSILSLMGMENCMKSLGSFADNIQNIKVKVKESRNRPGVTQRVQGVLGSQISMTGT